MNTYRQLIYMCLDQLKLLSDDSYYTEEHIMFLLNKCRALLLNQKYKKGTKEIPLSNYQTITLSVKEVLALPGIPCECEKNTYLKSTETIPHLMDLGNVKLYSDCFYRSDIAFIPMERMKYVGYNKYLKNIIYASVGPNNYLYLTSFNEKVKELTTINLTGIFEDVTSAFEDIDLDTEFPIEETLIEPLIEYVVKTMSGYTYRPKDNHNNSNDDLSDLMSFLQRNMKSNFQKQLE